MTHQLNKALDFKSEVADRYVKLADFVCFVFKN